MAVSPTDLCFWNQISDLSSTVLLRNLVCFELEILVCVYEVCKLSIETSTVVPDLATLRSRDMEGGGTSQRKAFIFKN
ncbi:hypothetical protein NQ318_001740 [Aromia moschata]|uniref:Uncharacterized protein n=1 Tax=Aromia moschata TaxID=1265417 RepID=A0AAV8XUE7_9CUCU|nr:hypothetical protein NQ318_001740 [Aromia moschata]